jgi:hypothetical protein
MAISALVVIRNPAYKLKVSLQSDYFLRRDINFEKPAFALLKK